MSNNVLTHNKVFFKFFSYKFSSNLAALFSVVTLMFKRNAPRKKCFYYLWIKLVTFNP